MKIFEKYLLSGGEQFGETDDYVSDLMEQVFSLIDTFDFDELSEEQIEMLDDILEMYDEDEEISEVKRERVVRGGKRVRKIKCPEGKKASGGRCVRMTAKEKRVRSKAAKRGARKKKGKQASIQRKRARSVRKR